jgi:hypothetical protein
MTEIPKPTESEVKPGIISRIMKFISRQRLEFQARISISPYFNHPFGGALSAEAQERIKRYEDEANAELKK